jgi:hypothetical protein
VLTEDYARLARLAEVQARVVRVNGADAPPHLRLVVELSARPPLTFEFFISNRWQGLA